MILIQLHCTTAYLQDHCRYSRFWSSDRLGWRPPPHAGMTAECTARTTDPHRRIQTQRLWLPWQRRRSAAMTSRWCKARVTCVRKSRSEAVRCVVRCLATPWRHGPPPPSKLHRHNTKSQSSLCRCSYQFPNVRDKLRHSGESNRQRLNCLKITEGWSVCAITLQAPWYTIRWTLHSAAWYRKSHKAYKCLT